MFKTILLFGAVFVQTISSQCVGYTSINRPTTSCGCSQSSYDFSPLTLNSLSATPSSPFSITSSSPIAPTSLTITSENSIEGPLSVYGQLPFLSGVAFEAMLPTSGYGSVAYRSGSGNVGMTSENYGNGLSDYGNGFVDYGNGLQGYSGFDGFGKSLTGLDKCGSSLSNARIPAYYGYGNGYGKCGCK